MSRRVCLAIGAANAKPLAYLPGAANAARDLGLWAKAAGFDAVTVITDEARVAGWRWSKGQAGPLPIPADPVTVQAIAAEIRALLPGDDETDLFLLHFAGHGLRQNGTRTLWMPTDWNSALRAVAVEQLKHRLEEFGIRNLTIVSDACRSFVDNAKLDNLSLDAVLGSGITARTEVALDRFNATYDGDEAYMINGAGPEEARCILSGVLVDALWGDEPAAVDKYIADKVTAGSLGEFLPGRTQEIGEQYFLASKAEVFPGQPRDHVVYLDMASKPQQPPDRSSWPAARAAVEPPTQLEAYRPGGDPAHIVHIIGLEGMADKGMQPDLTAMEPVEAITQYSGRSGKEQRAKRISSALLYGRTQGGPDGNLRLSGERARRIWSESAVTRYAETAWKVDVSGGAVQAVVEYPDGMFVPVVVYPEINTIVARDGPEFGGWAHASRRLPPEMGDTRDIVARMQAGLIAPAEIGTVAAAIRAQKHSNPMLGAIAAYLYDYIGDRDNIRRMAWYYKDHKQPVPYDVALMGVMESREAEDGSLQIAIPEVPKAAQGPNLPSYTTQATPAVDEWRVAGRCPWLRQGWDFVAAPEDAEKALANGLGQLIPHLLRSNFTAFDRKGGERSIQLWRLKGDDR